MTTFSRFPFQTKLSSSLVPFPQRLFVNEKKFNKTGILLGRYSSIECKLRKSFFITSFWKCENNSVSQLTFNCHKKYKIY